MGKTRNSKKDRPPAIVRGVLGRNVSLLRDRVYSGQRTVTARNTKLAEAIGSKLSQVQRICNGELGTSIDTVEWLAEALGVLPHNLLTPYFANSQDVQKAPPAQAEDERDLQRNGRGKAPDS